MRRLRKKRKLKRKKQIAKSSFAAVKTSLVKIAVILIIIGLNWIGLSAVVGTFAYFNDTETSSANEFNAATLDFLLTSAGGFSPNVTPAATSSRTVNVVNNGSLGFEYAASTTNAVGALCSFLNLAAKLNGAEKYNGPLSGFNAGPFVFDAPEKWDFTVSLISSEASLQNKNCAFDFNFDGEQNGGAGFSDTETVANTVESGEWEVNSCVTEPSDTISTIMTGSNFGANGHNLIIALGGELKSPTSGGANGVITVSTDCDVTTQNGGKITAVKGDGKGGTITVSARNFTVDSGGMVSVSSTASGKDGGSINLTAVNDIAIDGTVSANGHDDGGNVIATAGGDVNVSGSSLTAKGANKDGGDILLTATGNIDVPGLISTSAKDKGGTIILLAGGGLNVPVGGSVLAESANKNGGRIETVVNGVGDISGALSVDGKDGTGLVVMTIQGDMTVSGTGLISANSTNPAGKDGGTIGIKVGGDAIYSGIIRANATKNAKNIALWSEGSTAIGGTTGGMISAIGGVGGGDKGGVIDITTRATLSGDGTINAFGTVNGLIIQRTVANSFAGVATPAATLESIILNDIVLNEIIPDPIGADQGSSAMPLDGEWMELYNKSGAAVDVSGWVLRDADGNILTISATKGDNDGDLSDAGETIVPAGGTLTVYRNGAGGLTLNDAGDTVQLLTNTSVLVDSFTYAVDVSSGNSIARLPDGAGAWVDPEPTPTALNGGIDIDKLRQEFLQRLNTGVMEKKAAASEEGLASLVEIKAVENYASLFFSETLASAVSAITEFVLDKGETATSTSAEIIVNVPGLSPETPPEILSESLLSLSQAPSVTPELTINSEPSLDSPAEDPKAEPAPNESDLTEQAINNPQPPDSSPSADSGQVSSPQAGDDSSAQAPAEPAILAEPVTVESPPPPADSPNPTE